MTSSPRNLLLLLVFSLLFAAPSLSAQNRAPDIAVGDWADAALAIEPEDLSMEGGFVVFSPDSSVMKASYERFYFEREDFTRRFGDPASLRESFKLRALLVRLNDQVRSPGTPDLPAPKGGFTDRRYLAVVTSAAALPGNR